MHGSYLTSQVQFLLSKPDNVPLVTIEEKEKLIQNGGHYSSVVVEESAPTKAQIQTYNQLMSNKSQYAFGCNRLANSILEDSKDSDIVILSLVRAGTPLGVVIKSILEKKTGKLIPHYGISIIRDKGIDVKALSDVLKWHPKSKIYFVDGWTGKGTIAKSLNESLESIPWWNQEVRLVVYSDPAQKAWASVTTEDMVLPFGILNSTIAGLISRTVYRATEYHGVHVFENLKQYDLSQSFITEILNAYSNLKDEAKEFKAAKDPIQFVMEQYNEHDPNKIKASVLESIRAVLRRNPKVVVISSTSSDVILLQKLCKERGVPVKKHRLIRPYKAIAVLE